MSTLKRLALIGLCALPWLLALHALSHNRFDDVCEGLPPLYGTDC